MFAHDNCGLVEESITTFIQPLQSIMPMMLTTTQIQFLHKSITSYISTTTSIDYHATYLIFGCDIECEICFPVADVHHLL